MDVQKKVDYFVNTFETKNKRIAEKVNEYSEIAYEHPTFNCGLPTLEATETAARSIDEDSAVGSGMMPTRFLKRCSHVLAPVLHKLMIATLIFRKSQIP